MCIRDRVYPVAAISTSLEGRKLTDFAALQKAGAVALSDDGRPVPTAGMMAVAMERAARLGMPVLSLSLIHIFPKIQHQKAGVIGGRDGAGAAGLLA